MKTKIYLGILSFVLGLSLASCSEDDDYTIHTTPILNESSVVTGSSDVTATTATLHATLSGLDGMDAGSYKTGFFYGFAQDNLPEDVQAAVDQAYEDIKSGKIDVPNEYEQDAAKEQLASYN